MKVLRPTAKALIVHDGKFLALWCAECKALELPGGGMEFGETAKCTVIREVYEETKLKVAVTKLIDTWDLIKDDLHITGVIYLCKIEGTCEIVLSDEHGSYRWLDLDVNIVAEHVHSAFKNQIIKYIEGESQ